MPGADGHAIWSPFSRISALSDSVAASISPSDLFDPTFDGDGKVTTDFVGGRDQAFAVAIQGDGKIVAAGRADDESGFGDDFALARYNIDGSLDPTFNGDGKVTTHFAGRNDDAFAVAIQGDGKIVAARCANCWKCRRLCPRQV